MQLFLSHTYCCLCYARADGLANAYLLAGAVLLVLSPLLLCGRFSHHCGLGLSYECPAAPSYEEDD